MKNTEEIFSQHIKKIPTNFQNQIIEAHKLVEGTYSVFEHNMPVPPWKEGFEDIGEKVWEKIKQKISNDNSGISIYVHIPFCKDKKCGFCDCLSIAMTGESPVKQFLDTMLKEIKIWSNIPELKNKPVNVVYFGGGTPNSLPNDDFQRILENIEDAFNVTDKTQISVECPGYFLTDDKLDFLDSLNVNRLSVGIQTLEEPLRAKIGRHSTSSQILDNLIAAREKGFVTCGDIIYGLPEQTIHGFISTVKEVINVGIDGLSIYRFNVSNRNEAFVANKFPKFKNDEVLNYILFHIGHQMLFDAGYGKNHFIHFSKGDDNLYYRHLLRNDDLIAIGPTSDGIVGNYRYRHPHLKQYLKGDLQDRIVFEGGMTEPPEKNEINIALAQVMASEIRKDTFENLGFRKLFNNWVALQIVEEIGDNQYRLTGNGSWLVDQLIYELISYKAI